MCVDAEKTLQGLLAALVLLEEQGILHRVMSPLEAPTFGVLVFLLSVSLM
jgi:hypothetical protein